MVHTQKNTKDRQSFAENLQFDYKMKSKVICKSIIINML